MKKKNDSENLSIIRAALQAEWGSPAGRANVFFVILMILATTAEPIILEIINTVGAYITTYKMGKRIEPYVEQGISPLLVCTIGLTVFCLLLMVFLEIFKRKYRESKPKPQNKK